MMKENKGSITIVHKLRRLFRRNLESQWQSFDYECSHDERIVLSGMFAALFSVREDISDQNTTKDQVEYVAVVSHFDGTFLSNGKHSNNLGDHHRPANHEWTDNEGVRAAIFED